MVPQHLRNELWRLGPGVAWFRELVEFYELKMYLL